MPTYSHIFIIVILYGVVLLIIIYQKLQNCKEDEVQLQNCKEDVVKSNLILRMSTLILKRNKAIKYFIIWPKFISEQSKNNVKSSY